MQTSHRKVQIERGDCDPADIVFYPRYFAWFDASTAHHFKASGLPRPDLAGREDGGGPTSCRVQVEVRALFGASGG